MDRNKLLSEVTAIIESTLERHGVALAVLEGTRDDAAAIVDLLTPKASEPSIPEGYYQIATQDGTRLSRMTQFEYDGWVNGNYSSYGDYQIKAKRDFGKIGFYDHRVRGHIKEGWVIVKSGYNAMPGATWAHTRDDAMTMIDCLEAVEGDEKRFWNLLRAIQRSTGKLS